MRTFLISLMLFPLISAANAQDDGAVKTYQVNHSVKLIALDSVKLKIDETNAYYQKTVKVDSSITVSLIYVRALQFMAAKNFQQNYGYEQEGKLIFTSAQDLNANPVFQGANDDSPEPFTVQFAIIIDMKNGRYRYTVQNVIFYLPTENGNRRQTLLEVYQKAMDRDVRRYARDSAGRTIRAFERYLNALTNELHADIENKSAIHDPKF
jgi:hypothetical protein